MKVKLLTFVLILSFVGLFAINNTTYANITSDTIKLANVDSDKDGYSNLCEYLHKTDPEDAESKPSTNITINIPSDVKTIQEAINVAIDGDTIVVAQGKYQGNICFKGKSITLTSTEPLNSDVVSKTIIEGIEPGSVVTIDSNSVLKGFTITSATSNCRGIYIKNASPLIENCTIIDNKTTDNGAGIYNDDSSPKITGCVIIKNSSKKTGGGIYNTASSKPKITNSTISENMDNGSHESAQISGGNSQISQSWINGQGLVDNTTQTTPSDEELLTETTSVEPQAETTEPIITETEDSGDTDITIVETTDEGSPIIPLSGPIVWYVDDDAPDTGTGTSWEDAFKYLQDALSDTQILPGDEIWVAQGTYKPDQGIGSTPGYTASTFQLIDGVFVTGGYAGIGTPDPNARDIATYQTILSGDLLDNDGNPPDFANYNDNSYHVVTGSGTDVTAILDGFTITGGNANDSDAYYGGGGMYSLGGSLVINNCIFSYNQALYGAGSCIESTKSEVSTTTFTNCIFYNNHANEEGGGICNSLSPINTVNCVFSGNSANNGGAIANYGVLDECTPRITNCTFYGNSATTYGGGMYNMRMEPIVTNCIFWDNGDEIYNHEDSCISLQCERDPDNPDLMPVCHCVSTQANPIVSYSNIKGGYTGEGNINSDPLFVNINNPSGLDGIFFTVDDGLRIRINSPCIDAANGDTAPLTDITGFERIDIDSIPNTGTGTPNYADIGTCESGHDFDSDGMPDEWEVFYGLNPYDQYDADDDPDIDGLTNLQEYLTGTNPNDSDTDDDGLNDGDEVNVYNTDPLNPDSDDDLMPDGWEVQYSLDPLDPNDAGEDPDEDDLTNLEEYQNSTNPNDSDTDNDGMPDGWEVQYNLDPLDPIDATQDPDEDGLTNLEEYQMGTDPNHPNPVLVWEKTGLLSPVDVVVDNNRNVYVLESGASQVTIYDKDGTYLAPVILGASNPMGIALDNDGNLYIADTGYNRIMKMDLVDTELFIFSLDTTFSGDGIAGEFGIGDTQLDQPWGIGVDGNGNVYVTDSGNNRIQKLDNTGEFVNRWGTVGAEEGQFYQPKGIFVDAVGNIQIADSGNNRIQEFTSSGSLLNVWESTNLFYQPADLALNNYYIYVTDAGNNQVQKFDNYNEYITSLTNLNLNNPQGVAIDENLYQELIYIADTGNNRLLKAEIPIIPPDETWNDTKEALGTGNIELALENFDEASKERYSQIFTAIEAQLPTIISNMQAIELIYIRGDIAKYRIIRDEGGQDITYYIYFNKDENGKWKIRNF